jgi:hypothetical protein
MSSKVDTSRFEATPKGDNMNSFRTQYTQTKLEQLRHDARFHNALEPVRQQHLNALYAAIRTLFLELSALTIGSLEVAGNAQVQKHV